MTGKKKKKKAKVCAHRARERERALACLCDARVCGRERSKLTRKVGKLCGAAEATKQQQSVT